MTHFSLEFLQHFCTKLDEEAKERLRTILGLSSGESKEEIKDDAPVNMINGLQVLELNGTDSFCCTVKEADIDPSMRAILPPGWPSDEGQLEFYKLDDQKDWWVVPVTVICGEDEDKDNVLRFPGFYLTNREMLLLWLRVISNGGEISDGHTTLFS